MPALAVAIETQYGLNEKQRIFVFEAARGVSLAVAAAKAGYSEASARYLFSHPNVRAAFEDEIRRVLLTEDAPLARSVLRALMADEATSPRIRVDAAKILLDRAGITPPEKSHADADGRPLNELTASELMGFIGQRQAEIAKLGEALEARANAARLVNDAPNPDEVQDKAPDLLE